MERPIGPVRCHPNQNASQEARRMRRGPPFSYLSKAERSARDLRNLQGPVTETALVSRRSSRSNKNHPMPSNDSFVDTSPARPGSTHPTKTALRNQLKIAKSTPLRSYSTAVTIQATVTSTPPVRQPSPPLPTIGKC
ncbi:hypothetical protein ILUMI_20060 [Ignelater luminosus]|uniref:Uncharacterized protein n=1 Tax=Ignelater luminosus TaxID=2038154 RepID=A0A8K0CKF8_IGNLU|nr:hypothetical protein ILUMI_20060 [Ignelater luminosus]